MIHGSREVDFNRIKSAMLSSERLLTTVFKQERNKSLTNRLSYEEPYDCTRTYRVRIRARTVKNCNGSPQWSDWSDTISECCLSKTPPL